MIKWALATLGALVLLLGGNAIAAIIQPDGQDGSLAGLFAFTQVLILGGLGAVFLGDWATNLQSRLGHAKDKGRLGTRRPPNGL